MKHCVVLWLHLVCWPQGLMRGDLPQVKFSHSLCTAWDHLAKSPSNLQMSTTYAGFKLPQKAKPETEACCH